MTALIFVVEFLFTGELGHDFNLTDSERVLIFASNEPARMFTAVTIDRNASHRAQPLIEVHR
jgi:hypothetical protein